MRLLDNIPFTGSLKVDMEAMNNEPGVSFSVCVFWYGMPNATTNITPDEKTVQRKLPAYFPSPRNKTPGEVFPDPENNARLVAEEKGNIRFAGDQLDLLSWRDKNVAKHLDADGDNVLGSAGYILFGERILNLQGLQKMTASTLPPFISSFATGTLYTDFHNAGLFLPEARPAIHLTGLIQTTGDSAKNGLVSFVIGENPPAVFRLGIMLDNAGSYDKVGKLLWLTNRGNERSAKISLAGSNKIPDWYFFDCRNTKRGDTLTIHGACEKDAGIFSIGGATFDTAK